MIDEKHEKLKTMEMQDAVVTGWDYIQILRKIALLLIPISIIFPLVVIGAAVVKHGGF